METESRGQNFATFYSPNREDCIQLPDLPHLEAGKDKPATITSPDGVNEEYVQHSEMMESILKTALQKVKSTEHCKSDSENKESESGQKINAESNVDEVGDESVSESDEEIDKSSEHNVVRKNDVTERNVSDKMEFSIYILDGHDGNLEKVDVCSDTTTKSSHVDIDTT